MEWTNQITVINDYVIENVYDWKIVCRLTLNRRDGMEEGV